MNNKPTELTLDNESWEDMRRLGHKMMDDMVDFLKDIDNEKIWKEIPQETKDFLNVELPKKEEDPREIYKQFSTHILPYFKGNIHPLFFSWVEGNGTLNGAFADFLASIANPNVAIGEQSAMYVENQVINWCKEIFKYPETASGILLSGGSMANITGLNVARNSYKNLEVRKKGLKKLDAQMVFYCSAETHFCMQRAAEVMGIGSDNCKKIPVDENYKMRTDILLSEIKNDKKNGLFPFAVVGNAGTVSSGAIDDLEKIAQICKEEDLWFHVDGAYGAAASISDEYSSQLAGISLADSIAFDFHKWFYVNYEVGCLIVKDGKKHRDAFVIDPTYLLSHDRALAAGPEPFRNYGMELSRGFKALKVWMSLKEHGIEKYKKLISQNIAQARYLADLIKKEKDLELISDANLSIVLYRFKPENISSKDTERLNEINKELLMRMQEQAVAAPSYALLNGVYLIRVCIVNHRTKNHHLENMVKESIRIGREIISETK